MTLIDFLPSTGSPFQFEATFDGDIYNVIVTWNIFGQRFYINIYTLSGVRVLTRAMVGSPPDYDINLLPITFTSTMVYRAADRRFEITP